MMSARAKIIRAKQAVDIIRVLADFFPAAFAVYQLPRKPLKVGIHRDIVAATAGAIGEKELATALGYYCCNPGYLASCREGAERVGLDGKPAGRVTADEAAHAKELRLRLYKPVSKKPAPAPKQEQEQTKIPTGPPGDRRSEKVKDQVRNTNMKRSGRVSLADLRAAARARRGVS